LKLIHGGVVHKDPYYQNLLQQNVYHIVPVVNPDGLYMIEEDFPKTKKVLKKRKNQNPNAMESADKNHTKCAQEDAGVDLNRNYGVDWGVGVLTQVGLVNEFNIKDSGDISVTETSKD